MDAAALQVVEQGEVELPVFAEAGRVGEVGIGKYGRCALQRTFLVGVGTALGQLHVGVHVADVGTQAQVFDEPFAHLQLHAGSHAVVGILEAVQRGAALQVLDAFDGAVEVFEVAGHGEHVAVLAEAFVTQVEVVVVAVLQLFVTADLCRTVGLLVEEGCHLDERGTGDGARGREADAVGGVHRIFQVQGGEEVVLV